MANALADAPESSMASLAGGIVADARTLFKLQLSLAKREIADELHKVKEAAILLATGIVVAAVGGLLLAIMLVHWLHWASSDRLPLWSCFAIVSAVLVILGGTLFFLAMAKIYDV